MIRGEGGLDFMIPRTVEQFLSPKPTTYSLLSMQILCLTCLNLPDFA